MSDSTAYLVVTSITIPGKMEQMQNYASQVMPLLIKGGGETVARYGVVEQVNGEGGPKSIAVIKFPAPKQSRMPCLVTNLKRLQAYGMRLSAVSTR